MFRVNITLIYRIFVRFVISSGICYIAMILTRRIADSPVYVGVVEYGATGSRTELTNLIFSFSPFYGNLYAQFSSQYFYPH